MRVPEVLEDENWNGETKEYIHPTNKRRLCFQKITEHFYVDDESLEEHFRLCKLLNAYENEMVVISDDGVDEHEHIVEIVEKLYQSGEFANPAIKEDGEYEDNRIVKEWKI